MEHRQRGDLVQGRGRVGLGKEGGKGIGGNRRVC